MALDRPPDYGVDYKSARMIARNGKRVLLWQGGVNTYTTRATGHSYFPPSLELIELPETPGIIPMSLPHKELWSGEGKGPIDTDKIGRRQRT